MTFNYLIIKESIVVISRNNKTILNQTMYRI